ncbi:MAG: tetratricopeptide repeat protein [Kiritimatiellia bacterium]
MGFSGFKVIPAKKKKVDLLLSLGLGLFAFLIYALTLSRCVYPGMSAKYMAVFSGIEPSTLPVYPLWGTVVGWLSSIPFLSLAVRLNLFSALCVAVAVALIYRLVSFLIYDVIYEENVSEHAAAAAVAGALIAALALLFAVPVWNAATHLMVDSFNLMLACVMAFLLVEYAMHRWQILLVVFSFLAGASIVQSVYFIPLVPVFLIFLIYVLLKDGSLSLVKMTWMGAIALGGLSLYYLFARSFYQSSEVALLGHENLMSVLVGVWRFQVNELRSGAPRIGWLFLLFTSVVPWVAAGFASMRALNNERSWSQYLLHMILLVLVVITLTNSAISPWAILQPMGRLPVFCYGMVAMVAGYLFAYWYLLLKAKEAKNKLVIEMSASKAGHWMGMIFTWPTAIIVILVAIVNAFECKPNRGLFADKFAAETLAMMGGRTWFITDGTLDPHLQIMARGRGQELHLVCLQKDLDQYYLRSMERLIEQQGLFKGSDLVSMKSTLKLGILPFVQDWFAIDADVARRVAVFGVPDFWYSAGLSPYPNYLFFGGCRDIKEFQEKSFQKEYFAFWDMLLATLPEVKKGDNDPAVRLAANLRRHLGFLGNNLGVMLEDLGRDEEAFRIYSKIHSDVDPENISAMINRFEMARRGVEIADPYRDVIERELKDFISNLKHRYPLWSLSRYYGYVRSAQIYAQMGYGWALSGQTHAALAGINRAINLLPADERAQNLNSLAAIYSMTDKSEASAEVYREIISKDPDNRRALIGLGQLAIKDGAFKSASEWFEKAAKTTDSRESGGLEWAFVHLMNNDFAKARLVLQQTTDLQPKNLNAWALLAHLQLQDDEVNEVETLIIPKMEKIAGTIDNYFVQITRAMTAVKKGDKFLRAAREGFIRAARLNQSAVYLNDIILDLDIRMNDRDAALLHARQVLRTNRKHSLGNYVMGSLRLREGAYGEAEDFLRRSVDAKPIYPALNDLAETLRRIRKFEDAEKFARDAVKMLPDEYIAWETLASVLVDANIKLDEAESAVRKAVSLNSDDLRVQITLARILVAKGDLELARTVIHKVKSRQQELMPFEREELNKIAQSAAKKTGT